MQVYVIKNDQQIGPIEESEVLERLETGEFLPDDSAIQYGDDNWKKLGDYYPNFIKVVPAIVSFAETPPKKSRKGLLLGCSGFFLVVLLTAGVLGFLAYRNSFPADSLEDLPDTVKSFKLSNRYPPKGDIWGTHILFAGIYDNELKTQSIIYMMKVFSDESAAKDVMRADLIRTCQSGETQLNFSFVDESGKDISQGATCGGPMYIQKGNRLTTLGGSGAGAATYIEFAENLPFNKGTKMKAKTE